MASNCISVSALSKICSLNTHNTCRVSSFSRYCWTNPSFRVLRMDTPLLYRLTDGILIAAEPLWPGLFAGHLFRSQVGHRMGFKLSIAPALVF